MVYLERGSVMARFPRDRNCAQAYPLPAESAGPDRKSYNSQALAGFIGRADGAVAAELQEGRIAPVEK
jgi:hypothetical protein